MPTQLRHTAHISGDAAKPLSGFRLSRPKPQVNRTSLSSDKIINSISGGIYVVCLTLQHGCLQCSMEPTVLYSCGMFLKALEPNEQYLAKVLSVLPTGTNLFLSVMMSEPGKLKMLASSDLGILDKLGKSHCINFHLLPIVI